MKTEILTLLRNREDYISGQELCNRFGVSRTAVWKVMNNLKEEGYVIEAVQNKGYKLVSSPDIMDEHEIKSRLRTRWAGSKLYYYQETGSTNTDAKGLAEQGDPHGTLVVADMQTGGKGRRGRSWQSSAGTTIAMSIVCRPDFMPDRASMLTLVMGLSVAQAIREVTGLDSSIKWPNDIVVNGKKVCGILTEMSAELDYIQYLVIGVGINVNNGADLPAPERGQTFPEEIRDMATSLFLETGKRIPRAELIAAVMDRFEQNYETFLQKEDLSELSDTYNQCLVNRNQEVRVLDPKGSYDGFARGIDDQGNLLVEKADGTIEKVYSGEVSVRGLYGYV